MDFPHTLADMPTAFDQELWKMKQWPLQIEIYKLPL
jgi:hypothetical protein